MFINFIICLTAFLGSLAISHMVWQHAYRFGLQDVPNERSSHFTPIPRGGGLAIFLNFFSAVVVGFNVNYFDRNWLQALMVGGSLVFLIGLWDDRWSLPARARLIIHFVAALWTMIFVTQGLHGIYAINIGVAQLTGVFLCGSFGVLFVAWMVNLYNFMDGIDGQAGGVGFVVAVILGVIAYNLDHTSWMLYMALAASIAGFLLFNWQPAKIFMGDCGSGFLGFIFAALALLGELRGGVPLVATVILLSPFVVDATYTLMVRIALGQRPYEPHKEFTFQRFIQRGWQPSQLVFAQSAVILLYNAPLAFASVFDSSRIGIYLVAGYAPFLLLAIRAKAGFPLHKQSEIRAATPVVLRSVPKATLDSVPDRPLPRRPPEIQL